MDLKNKLDLYYPIRTRAPESSSGRIDDLDQWIRGRSIHNAHGQFFLATETYPSGYQHGNQILSPGLIVSQSVFSWIGKDETLRSANISGMLFLDTETTGLAGGAGTVPFMIGLGYYEGSNFIIEQYFMRNFPEERAMLNAFLERLSQFQTLVTFNGKCFDINLLNSRFVMHRIPNVFRNMSHLDMLFAARRLYKRRLNDCSLASIENHILDFRRTDDVPGYIIPGLYFQFLRSGRAEQVAQVFNHNRLDILSLISLTFHTAGVYQYSDEVLKNETDLISLGRAFESLELIDQAVACYEKAVQLIRDQSLQGEVLFRLAQVYKHLGLWERAVSLWKHMTNTDAGYIKHYEELAKYYEHQTRDYSSAIRWVKTALNRLKISEQLESSSFSEMDRRRLIYRLNRLKKKAKGAIDGMLG